MSRVENYLILAPSTGGLDGPGIAIGLHIAQRIERHAGGNKAIEADIYACALNRVDLPEVAHAVHQWASHHYDADDRRLVQLLHLSQEADRWVLYDWEMIILFARERP